MSHLVFLFFRLSSTTTFFPDNHVYGFDPHDDSDYLTISGNTCYNNGKAAAVGEGVGGRAGGLNR